MTKTLKTGISYFPNFFIFGVRNYKKLTNLNTRYWKVKKPEIYVRESGMDHKHTKLQEDTSTLIYIAIYIAKSMTFLFAFLEFYVS